MPAFHPFHIGLALAAPASTAVYLGGTYAFSAVIFPVLHDRRITAETAHDTLKVILDHGPKTLAPVALIAAGVSAIATYYIPASARTAYAVGTAALAAIGAWTTWAILPLHTRVSILGKEEIRAHYLGTLASRYQVRTLLAAVALGSQLYGFWTSRWIIV